MRGVLSIRFGVAVLIVALESTIVLAQPRDVRTQMADLLRYTGIENP